MKVFEHLSWKTAMDINARLHENIQTLGVEHFYVHILCVIHNILKSH